MKGSRPVPFIPLPVKTWLRKAARTMAVVLPEGGKLWSCSRIQRKIFLSEWLSIPLRQIRHTAGSTEPALYILPLGMTCSRNYGNFT